MWRRLGWGIVIVVLGSVIAEGWGIGHLIHLMSQTFDWWSVFHVVGILVLALLMVATVAIGIACWLMAQVNLFWSR